MHQRLASGAQYATEARRLQRSDFFVMIRSMQDAYEHENTGCGLGASTGVFLDGVLHLGAAAFHTTKCMETTVRVLNLFLWQLYLLTGRTGV
jgi:hypothetical protein